ncbi:MAG: NrfD/PsrC family molybdoenzyme membrane anchor subunit [Chloroflexota bacterium]
MNARPLTIALGAVWLAAFAAGTYGLGQRMLTGHEQANYGSYVPWGLWVAMYIYFVGLSAGAFLLSSLIYVFGLKRLEPIGKLALFTATITLCCALLVIWLDLGQPFRFWKVYANVQPTSMMAWMVWLYTAYFLLVLTETWFALRADLVVWGRRTGLAGWLGRTLTAGSRDMSSASRDRDRRVLQVLGTLGVPLAIAFHGGVGALFGVLGARPYWNTSLLPIMFLVGALASGGALLTFVVAYFWPEQKSAQYRDLVTLLGRMALGLLAFDLILEWSELSINLYASIPAHAEAFRTVLFGQFWWVFWIGHLALGAAVPILLLALFPRTPKIVGAAGLLIAATFITVRLNIVVPGLVHPELVGLERAYTDLRLTFAYIPSMMEFLVGLFVVAFGVGLFLLGRWLLPLTTDDATSPLEPLPRVDGHLAPPSPREPSLAAR